MGWHRDLVDFRDSTPTRQAPRLSESSPRKQVFQSASKSILSAKPKKSEDNRAYCPPIEDQESLGSCTAHAGVGLVEYMERIASGRHVDASHLFLYKVTRKLLGWTGDTGAFLRTTMQALALFGVPPDDLWPYDLSTFDNEPDAFLYAYASNYQSLQYMRLDPAGAPAKAVLDNVRSAISKKYAAMFGFTVYSSLGWDADIPFPGSKDSVSGGHAILAVGYDDNHSNLGTKNKGALLIRNSWGKKWGEDGYGWLPYDYIQTGLASDFWTCMKQEWIDSKEFD
ncbi:MAG: C1 family peptidase [Candidatus Hydrogenedentales bacterium]